MNYASVQQSTLKLIRKSGVTVTINRLSTVPGYIKKYDPALMKHFWEEYPAPAPPAEPERLDTPPDGALKSWDGFGVVTEWPLSLIDGENVQFEDVQLMISTEAELQTRDRVVLSGITYTVYPPIERIKPDGATLILQTVNARRE